MGKGYLKKRMPFCNEKDKLKFLIIILKFTLTNLKGCPIKIGINFYLIYLLYSI